MPTATEKSSPSLPPVFDDLNRLKNGIATALAAEDELRKSRQTRSLKLAQEITAREATDAETFNTRLAQLAENHRQAVEAQHVANEARKARLHQAYHASRAALAQRVHRQKDQQVGEAQINILARRKQHQQALDEATAAHQILEAQVLADSKIRHELRDSTLAAFRSFKPLLKPLFRPRPRQIVPPEISTSEQFDIARNAAAAAHKQPLAKFFRYVPFLLLMAIIGGVWFWITRSISPLQIGVLSVLFIGWLVALFQALPVARRASHSLMLARSQSQAAWKRSAEAIKALQSEMADDEKSQTAGLTQTLQETDEQLKSRIHAGQLELQQQHAGLPDRLEKRHQRNLAKLDLAQQQAVTQLRGDAEKTAKTRGLARATAGTANDFLTDAAVAKLTGPWQSEVIATRQKLAAAEETSLTHFPAWTAETCAAWTPTTEAPPFIRIGQLEIDTAKIANGLPADPRLALPPPADFPVPLHLDLPNNGSLLIETDGDATPAIEALNAISIRLLATLPPGRAAFTFIDPVGLGRGFAGLMHLADYEETLINHRIWTQTTQIEERLAELNEHLEKVIQMYLRNEFATIADYNAQAGTVAEKYRFLVIAGFPAAFSETAARRLRSIAASGARCGVHLLIQRDLRLPSVDPALDAELAQACTRVTLRDGNFRLADAYPGADKITFDAPPTDEDATTLIHKIGRASIDSSRVEVPFSQIAPPEDSLWKLDTSDELRVPVGRSGAKKLQTLAIGKGTRQHALIAGKTGSGKSTLFHVIITNLALWCSPDQVEFYLVDFKKGVEFKCYADKKLPHARVIAIESDRQFALSVLQKIDAELKHRGELFRIAGAQDLASYNRSGRKLPRTLLLIDEFQEFFTEDDSVAQQASLLLDRIVRQGRAFGIHAILGSQTLGGAYTLARATLGQMAVRIALQCNEADAHLIMDEDNPAPRLLTRPGEGIYNDQSGAFAANSPFQIVWLPEAERTARLDQINALARASGHDARQPIVFEGNAPAELSADAELAKIFASKPTTRPSTASAWLGAPNSIKSATAAAFKRQTGSNLLIVSQSAERSISLLASSIISLAAQFPADQVEFIIFDPHAADDADSSILKQIAATLPRKIQLAGPAEIPAVFAHLSETLESRAADSGKSAPEIFLIIHDLQRFKALRPDDEFRFSYDDTPTGPSPSQTLANLLSDGGPSGIHVLASIDGWNNVSRWIPRKLLAEFEMRVLFQMSASDSANLIDSPDAAHLGLHRALFHNEHLGTLETFRPYSPPDASWLTEITGNLRERFSLDAPTSAPY